MEMEIVLAGGDRVEARFRGRSVMTEQDGSAPAPFELFLASIGTCAGFYVARFCQQRSIPTEGIRIRQRTIRPDGSPLIRSIEIEVELPDSFPERYRAAVLRAAEACTVKKHLAEPPEITVRPAAALVAAG